MVRVKYFLGLGLIIVWMTCKEKEEGPPAPPPSIKLDGLYDVISIVCEYPIDLDRDGITGFDLLTETHEAKNDSLYYMELNSEIYHWEPDYYDQRIFLWIPFTHVFQDEDGNVLDVKYSFTNLLAKYRYDEQTQHVSILGNLGGGEVTAARVISEDTLEIQFSASFYSTKGWEWLPLKGLYKRRR